MKKYWERKRAESMATVRKRKQITAAQKKAISERMKKYWAKRRAEKTRGK